MQLFLSLSLFFLEFAGFVDVEMSHFHQAQQRFLQLSHGAWKQTAYSAELLLNHRKSRLNHFCDYSKCYTSSLKKTQSQ